jgi:hypothetical protein
LAEGRSASRWVRGRISKGKRAKEIDGGVKKRKHISPDNMSSSRVRNSSMGKLNTVEKIDSTVTAMREAVPQWPPATREVRKEGIIGCFLKE